MDASGISEATGAGQDHILSRDSTKGVLSDWLPKEESTHGYEWLSTLSMQQRGRGRQKAKSTRWDLRGAKAIFLLFTKLFLQFFLVSGNEPSDLVVKCK